MSNYLKIIDLNPPPAMGGVVSNPLDLRAYFAFGFVAKGQEITLVNPVPPAPSRLYGSWQYANQPIGTVPVPAPQIDEVLDTMTFPAIVRYDENHDADHAILWVDPAALPPAGTPFVVKIRAWA